MNVTVFAYQNVNRARMPGQHVFLHHISWRRALHFARSGGENSYPRFAVRHSDLLWGEVTGDERSANSGFLRRINEYESYNLPAGRHYYCIEGGVSNVV